MGAQDLRDAIAEYEDRQGDMCPSCGDVVHELYAPYCFHCGSYFEDVKNGLFADPYDFGED